MEKSNEEISDKKFYTDLSDEDIVNNIDHFEILLIKSKQLSEKYSNNSKLLESIKGVIELCEQHLKFNKDELNRRKTSL
jgi:hypothetical protein